MFMSLTNEPLTGIKDVDTQHGWLVDVTNRLHDEFAIGSRGTTTSSWKKNSSSASAIRKPIRTKPMHIARNGRLCPTAAIDD